MKPPHNEAWACLRYRGKSKLGSDLSTMPWEVHASSPLILNCPLGGFKPAAFVRTIAKWFFVRVTTSAQGN